MEITLKKTEPMQAVLISHIGSYREAGRLYGDIVKWLRQKRLQIAGPPFGWFYDNPQEVQESKLRSEVGFPFKGEAKSEGNIKIKKIPAQEVLYTVHRGPYMEVGPAYSALFQHAREKGYIRQGCPTEIYLNDLTKVREDALLTEVQLPVKKR
jgi:effector-binding domain-containing protein